MVVGHVDGAASEPDLLRLVQEPRDEDQRRGDGLRRIRHMLADEAFDEAELVREDGHLAVFLQRLVEFAPDWMDGHGEEAELHLVISGNRFGSGVQAAEALPERGARARNIRRR